MKALLLLLGLSAVGYALGRHQDDEEEKPAQGRLPAPPPAAPPPPPAVPGNVLTQWGDALGNAVKTQFPPVAEWAGDIGQVKTAGDCPYCGE